MVLKDLGVTVPLPGEGRDGPLLGFPILVIPRPSAPGDRGGRCEVEEEKRERRGVCVAGACPAQRREAAEPTNPMAPGAPGCSPLTCCSYF